MPDVPSAVPMDPPKDLAALLTALGRQNEEAARSQWVRFRYNLALTLLATVSLLANAARSLPGHWYKVHYQAVGFAICGAGLAVTVPPLFRELRAAKQAHSYGELIRRVAQADDLRVVGPLADALRYSPERALIVSAFLRLLPRMTSADGELLNPQQRANLYPELSPRVADDRPDLQIAILHALGQIGDRRARPYVKRLAESHSRTPNQQRVQDAARACLLNVP